MIPQLVQRIMSGIPGISRDQAMAAVLTADPLDLVLHMEEVWTSFRPPAAIVRPNQSARRTLIGFGKFAGLDLPRGERPWEHLGYSYVLENTRAVQIIRRVVREFRSGEGLGIPTEATQRWLDATEALLFGAPNPFPAWLSTSEIRPNAEANRRRDYWGLFGVDLAFGTDDNQPPVFDKPTAANTSFIGLFEELLFELWQAMTNVRNIAGANTSDNDRIFRLAEALKFVLMSRRKFGMLDRGELAAATVLGWIDLTLSADNPVVVDAGAQATSAANRLANLGAKVNLSPHGQSSALFSMAPELSHFLRTIESGVVEGPQFAWILYLNRPPPGQTRQPIGNHTRRVITDWGDATKRNLKAGAKPIETAARRELLPAR